jgi:hypothetical protein
MAFSDEEIARYSALASAFCERKIPVHVHHQVWMGFRIEGQSITLIEYRVHWKDRTKTTEHPIAKTTYNRKTEEWRLYWMRADLKWHGYQPCPSTDTFEGFLEEVDRDEWACFFG